MINSVWKSLRVARDFPSSVQFVGIVELYILQGGLPFENWVRVLSPC